jgi:hypothetical protein
MRFTPRLAALSLLIAAIFAFAFSQFAAADYPKPSPYPIAWQLKFENGTPTRVVVDVPGRGNVAYWYMTYTVTNNTDEERTFLPFFEMMTNDGKVYRSDKNVPKAAFDAVKQREKKPLLEAWTTIGGELRLGEDQAKDGVAIWEEPTLRMGKFSIFVGGLSGETVTLKDDKGQPMKDKDGNPVILRKTLQLNYHIRGDDVYPGEDEVNVNKSDWVMR